MTQLARYDTRPALRWMCDLGFASLCSRVGPCPCSALRPTGTRVFCSLLLGFRLRRKPIKHIADIGRGKRAFSIEEACAGRSKRVVVNHNPQTHIGYIVVVGVIGVSVHAPAAGGHSLSKSRPFRSWLRKTVTWT